MAKVAQLTVGGAGGLTIMNASQRIDWGRFKNTPGTLVSATGHDHNAVYYGTATVDNLFGTQEARIAQLELDIEVLAYKTDFLMGGGGATANSTIHNYNNSTQAQSTLSTTLLNACANAPGISTQRTGYFFSETNSTNKIDYFTLVLEATSNCPIGPQGSLIDFAIQSKGFMTDGAGHWAQLNILLDVWTSKDNALGDASNQVMLSSMVQGYSKGTGFSMAREYTHSSGVSRDIIEFYTESSTVGLCKSSIRGFWLSNAGNNWIHDYNTDTVSALTSLVTGARAASTCTTEFYGVIASGAAGTQVNKLTWSTLSISAMTSLSQDKTGASTVEI